MCGSRTCKPNSVRSTNAAGRSFLWDGHYCPPQATYPEVVTRRAGTYPRPFSREHRNHQHSRQNGRGPSLFGLAPCGVCHARVIAAAAVRSYRTFSPLPRRMAGRYLFCGTFRPAGLNPPSRTLSGTLPCGVRTFLPVTWAGRPSGPAAYTIIIFDAFALPPDRFRAARL